MTTPPLASQMGPSLESSNIYNLYFHGPAYQVIERVWRDGKRIVALMSNKLPSNHYPADLPTVVEPRLIELCFQAAGIWEMAEKGHMGLPQHIDRVSLFRKPEAIEGRLYAVVTPAGDAFDAEVVDEAGNTYVQLNGYRTVAVPNLVDEGRLKAVQNQLSIRVAVGA